MPVAGGQVRLAWGTAALSSVLTASALVIGGHDGGELLAMSQSQLLQQALLALTFPVLGALLVTASSGNRLGWVFSVIGLSRGASLATLAWALHDYTARGHWPIPGLLAFVSIATAASSDQHSKWLPLGSP